MSKDSKEIATDEELPTQITAHNQIPEYLREYGTDVLETLSQKDIIMARYKLIQNTSKSGTPGKWVSSLTPDNEMDYLDIIILGISNFRTYFPPPGQGEKPICRSNDGYRKSDPNGVGDGECDSCRFSIWTRDARGESKPAPCKEGYTLLGLVIIPEGSMEIGMVSFKGSAIKPCRAYFTHMKTRGVAPFTYITRIKTTSAVSAKGRYFKPEFEFGPWLDKDIIDFAADQAKLYKKVITRSSMVDIESEESVSAPGGAQDFLDSLEGPAELDINETELPF